MEQVLSLTGTLSLSAAQTILWDVVVIGAGVAGSVAAREAARAGLRVLLIDKRNFPRQKVCGACLNDVALDVLARIGLSGEVDALGGSRLNNFSFHCGSRSISVPLPSGLAISRASLDSMLIRTAIAVRVEFLPNVVAKVGPDTGNARVVRLMQGAREFSLKARTIVVATGLCGVSRVNSKEWTTCIAKSSRVGAGCIVEEPHDDYAAGTIWMAAGAGGYAGLVRVEDGRLNIACAFDRDYLRHQGSPAEATRSLLENVGFPVPSRLRAADWQGTPPLTRTTTPVVSQRVFLVGDAAGYVEPFTGEGMAWALVTAERVVPWIGKAVAQDCWSPAIAKGWTAEYRQLVHHRQRFCLIWARLLRSPMLVAIALSALSSWPWLARRLVRHFTSHNAHGKLPYEHQS